MVVVYAGQRYQMSLSASGEIPSLLIYLQPFNPSSTESPGEMGLNSAAFGIKGLCSRD